MSMEILDMESMRHLPLAALSDELQLLPPLLAGEQRAFRQHQAAVAGVESPDAGLSWSACPAKPLRLASSL
ncbi:hypothetical protein KHO49_27850 [Pseudomonas sp. RC4D1]|uniref:hypothetical protein n=1 Tax=Pseudomonas sp. RC4D1 TaxID=2834407 RepID=UPI001BCDAB2B|nr:hypothetical protein [Pseudomonas sp. RC4D1]MBS7562159.1 hypothetical protein [Pseudomonas sp. RC4D1]